MSNSSSSIIYIEPKTDYTSAGTILANFVQGVFQGAIGDIVGNVNALIHLDETIASIKKLSDVADLNSAEDYFYLIQLALQVQQAIDYFQYTATDNDIAKIVGNIVGAILIELLISKGIALAADALKAVIMSGKLLDWLIDISKGLRTKATVISMVEAAVETINKLKNILGNVNGKLEELFASIKKITKFDDHYEVATPDGLVVRIERSEVSNVSKIDEIAEDAAKAESAASRGAFQRTDETGEAIVDIDAADGISNSLDWDAIVSKKGETRIDHINRHSVPRPDRQTHGVFNENPVTAVNNAWNLRNTVTPIDDGMGGYIYNIPYQNAGYESGFLNTGTRMDYITIVTKKNTNELIAAFPSFGNYGL